MRTLNGNFTVTVLLMILLHFSNAATQHPFSSLMPFHTLILPNNQTDRKTPDPPPPRPNVPRHVAFLAPPPPKHPAPRTNTPQHYSPPPPRWPPPPAPLRKPLAPSWCSPPPSS
nr:hypothetical protein Iba_chr05cCG14550 [Ipomoea batatas]